MSVISSVYKKLLLHRYDGESCIKYFSAEDYPGLGAEPVSFDSDGNTLRGFFYSRAKSRSDILLIFCHGIGGGHRSYMAEIDMLCTAGFKVLAYDNTGCFASDGDDIRSLSRSLADLDNALAYLKREGIFEQYRGVYAIGHSWGGFAAGCIPLFHEDVRKAVVISGFLTVETLLGSQLGGMKFPLKKLLLKRLLSLEAKADPAHKGASVCAAMEKGTCRYLIAHSRDDAVVPYAQNAALLQERFPDARYLITDGRKHNPNYAQDAVDYMNETFGTFNRLVREKKLSTEAEKAAFFADADWRRMTAQDPGFWEEVTDFLLSQ